jgi:hypothetical protein
LSEIVGMAATMIERLDAALRGIVVRAWRLHLETPGVMATVPMLRGVWGAALKKICESTYHDVFVGGDAGAPRYVMRPAPPEIRSAPAIEFLFFGQPDRQADDNVWAAWDLACRSGLGPHRYPFTISESHPLAWNGTPLASSQSQPGFALSPLPWPTGAANDVCRLDFPAPLRIIHRGRLVEQPALADVTIAALRRIQSLTTTLAEPLWPDRQWWLDEARRITCGPWDGARLDLIRYSGRQKRELELRGVSGSLLLPEGPGLLAPLLAASAWLHLGKSTVMGLGQLRITAEQASI